MMVMVVRGLWEWMKRRVIMHRPRCNSMVLGIVYRIAFTAR